MSLPLGISVQPAAFLSEGFELIVDYDQHKRIRYWGGHEKGWVDQCSEAKTWPVHKQGEIPYAENNAYMLWTQYAIGPYGICPFTYGLHPCLITFGEDQHLFLKDVVRNPQEPLKLFSRRRLETVWTNDIMEAKKFWGVAKVKPIFFEIVQEAGF